MDSRPWRILLVEGDEDDYARTRTLLSEAQTHRFGLQWVATYEDGLSALGRKDLDAVLIDHHLGERSGMDLTREAVAQGFRPPIILLTDGWSSELDAEVRESGAADCLAKDDLSAPLLERAICHAIDRRQAERESRRVSRALRMLSRCERAALQATEETELLHEACRVIVGVGGYCLAWAGFAEQDEEKRVRPLAQAGYEEGYLRALRTTWADTEDGRGPTGTAIRTGKPVICKNILTDPQHAAWRAEASMLGYAASIALPLTADGQTLGVLNICAQEPDAFDPEEVELLTELAGDLAFRIAELRTRAQRQRGAEHEIRSAAVLEATTDFVGIADANGRTLYLNPAGRRMVGIGKSEDISDLSIFDFIPQRASPFAQSEVLPAVVEDGLWKGETAFVGRGGREVPVSLVAVAHRKPGGETDFLSLVARDITERVRAEKALRRAEARCRSLFETVPVGLYRATPAGEILDANPAMVQMLGFPDRESLLAVNASDLHVDPEDRWREQSLLEKDGVVRGFELELRRRDGTTIWVRDAARPAHDADGRILYYDGGMESIAGRKREEEELRQQLARARLLNETARAIAERPDLDSIFSVVLRRLKDHLEIDLGSVYFLDPDAHTLTVAAREPLAAKLERPEGMVIPVEQTALRACVQGETVHMPDLAQADGPLAQEWAQVGMRSAVAVPLAVENQVFGVLIAARRDLDAFTSADRELLHALSHHVSLAVHQARLYEDLQRACDELRQTREAAQEQERLQVLGRMSSGIAHDINNAISPAVIHLAMLLKEPDLSDRVRERLQVIKTAHEDVAGTVARMRQFYRKREEQAALRPIDPNQLVQQVIELTRPRWKSMPEARAAVVDVHTHLQHDLPPVIGIESEIREALTNLVINAVDAMPDGGRLAVRSYVGGWAGKDREEPTHVIVEVSDTGTGMDEETKQRCFEPFFSTKGGRGTGLGLAVAYGVMQRHGGDIVVQSAVDRGTTVRLIFPVAEHSDEGPAGEEAAVAPSPLQILVVDDEQPLLDALEEMLEGQGHAVEVADTGQGGLDAFRAAQKRDEPFDVVITDLGMPYVDGRQVARTVKAESPATPVILLTGWGVHPDEEDDLVADVECILGKPPKIDALNEALAGLKKEAETAK